MRNTQHPSYSLLIQYQFWDSPRTSSFNFVPFVSFVVVHLFRHVIYQPFHCLGWRIRSPRCSLYLSLLSVGGYDSALRGECSPSRVRFAAAVGERREDGTR